MRKIGEIYGKRFGKLLVITKNVDNQYSDIECQCDCGNKHIVKWRYLQKGRSRSCGCLQRETVSKLNFKHGYSFRGKRAREYQIWTSMIKRCFNSSFDKYIYSRYGGRGITVCDRWRDFKNFFDDMGLCPENFTLERRDNNGNYCKENCEWVSRKENCRNKSNTIYTEFNGKQMTIPEISDITGIKYGTLKACVEQGRDINAVIDKLRKMGRIQ